MSFFSAAIGGVLLSGSLHAATDVNNAIVNTLKKEQTLQHNKNIAVLVINKNTKAGQIILKSQKEYLKLLKKRIKLSQINEVALQQIQKNNCEIENIKIVLAKLIQEMEKLKQTKASKKELKALYNLIEKQNKKIKQLQDALENSKKFKLESVQKKINFLNKFIKEDRKKEKICKVVKIPIYETAYSLKDINKSYIKYKNSKEFVAQTNLLQYNYPLLWAKTNNYPVIKKGTHFKADMWTYAGWVHIQNQGWVRGFLLYPKVLQKKSFFKKHPTKYIEKVVCETK